MFRTMQHYSVFHLLYSAIFGYNFVLKCICKTRILFILCHIGIQSCIILLTLPARTAVHLPLVALRCRQQQHIGTLFQFSLNHLQPAKILLPSCFQSCHINLPRPLALQRPRSLTLFSCQSSGRASFTSQTAPRAARSGLYWEKKMDVKNSKCENK